MSQTGVEIVKQGIEVPANKLLALIDIANGIEERLFLIEFKNLRGFFR